MVSINILKTVRHAVAGVAVSVVMASAAAAATLTIVGGSATTLPASYNPACGGGCTTPAVGDPITAFSAAADGGLIGGGLSLDSAASLKFTFIGKEAGAQNAVFSIGGATLTNTGGFNTSFTVFQNVAGFVQFLFRTAEGGLWDDINGNSVGNDILSINNGGTADFSGLSLAFSSIFNGGKSVYAFFGDGRGDVDYDDMVVRIDVVPLPAAGLLMLGALGGLGLLRARRRKAEAAA